MEKKKGLRAGSDITGSFRYLFHLFVTGASPNSVRAVANIKSFLEKNLSGQYDLEIIDVYQQPHIAKSVDIIALPLMIRKFPLPEKRLIGDMSNNERLFKTLDPVDLFNENNGNI